MCMAIDSVNVGGLRIGFERTGAGPALLLIGGTGMPPIAWQACGLRDALVEAGFDVVAYASRGVAPSDAPPAPYSIPDLAADAAGLLDRLGLKDVVVVGYSLGSFTAEVLAQLRPDLVRAVVLMAGAGPLTPLLEAVVQMESDLIATIGRIPAAAAAFQTLLTGLPPATLREDETTVSQWVQMLGMQEQMWTSIEGENGQSAASADWLRDPYRMQALTSIRVPVLVVAFEYDLYFPPRSGRAAVARLPNGEFVEVVGAAHAGLMTHPERTREVLMEFVNRSKASS